MRYEHNQYRYLGDAIEYANNYNLEIHTIIYNKKYEDFEVVFENKNEVIKQT